MQIILFIICLNVATTLVTQLGIAGTAYVNPTNTTGPSEDYASRFNASDVAVHWTPTTYGIPVIGDIFGGFYLFFNTVKFVIAGFPLMLVWIGDTYIVDAAGKTAYNFLIAAILVPFYVLMAIWVIEFISGRYMND
jgi:hypothetical protein